MQRWNPYLAKDIDELIQGDQQWATKFMQDAVKVWWPIEMSWTLGYIRLKKMMTNWWWWSITTV